MTTPAIELPAYTPGNVLVGVAAVYTAAANTALPANSVPLNGAWPAGWTAVGATEQGVTLVNNPSTQKINIEEQSNPVKVLVTTRAINVTLSLAEDTIASMQLAYGGGTTTTTAEGAAGTGIPANTTLSLSDDLNEIAVGLEGVNAHGFPRRIYLPICNSVGNVSTPYRRAAGARVYPVTFEYIGKLSAVQIIDITSVTP